MHIMTPHHSLAAPEPLEASGCGRLQLALPHGSQGEVLPCQLGHHGLPFELRRHGRGSESQGQSLIVGRKAWSTLYFLTSLRVGVWSGGHR